MHPFLTRGRLLLLGGLALVALTACTPDITIQAPSPQQSTGIAVTGTGYVVATPDGARINLGVSVTASTVAKARGDAAAAMQRVQDVLKQQGVADKDVQTQSFSISPQYDYSDRATPRITGYQVNNQVQVTVRKLDSASEVLDATVAAGGDAVRVNGISFEVDKPEALLAPAREDAVQDARARAEVLAKAAGATLGAARSISESTGGGFPPPIAFDKGMAASAEAPTPLNPGEQRLAVTVSIVYDLLP